MRACTVPTQSTRTYQRTQAVQMRMRRAVRVSVRLFESISLRISTSSPICCGSSWGATVRGTYPTPEAGTRTQYVLYVGPWGQAALRLRYVHNAGGWYA